MLSRAGRSFMRSLVVWAVIALLVAPVAGAGASPRVRTGARSARTGASAPFLRGRLRAPGGPFLVDRFGRVVILHGVNVVYKHPPFEVFSDPGHPWSFTEADARRIARLGFDVVRLGILWQGLEPGTLAPNDPRVCSLGRPGNPHQLDLRVLRRYLERLRTTVDLLARFHIYTLLDMHQDVYSTVLGGEGAPPWAVCTNGIRPVRPPGRWSKVYGTAAADAAFGHFWRNDVVGNLQGQFDKVWGIVARFFRHDPWVVGFDPFNEPFSVSVLTRGGEHFDAQLECFYTGTAHIGRPLHGAPAIHCPPGDPRTGVIPTIERADPGALVFFEPDIYASRGLPTFIGPMPFGNLVFNIHVYCPGRNPRTGNPVDPLACVRKDTASLRAHEEERAEMGSRVQRGGPAWFVSEFGATSSTVLVKGTTALLDHALVGWTYWSWKYYADPTGSADEALVRDTGRLRPTVADLSEPYAQAIAGTPVSMSFDVSTQRFTLEYRTTRSTRRRTSAPTLVVVPRLVHYRRGYCATVRGGRVLSAPDAAVLEVENGRLARVVRVLIVAAPETRRVDGKLRPVCS